MSLNGVVGEGKPLKDVIGGEQGGGGAGKV